MHPTKIILLLVCLLLGSCRAQNPTLTPTVTTNLTLHNSQIAALQVSNSWVHIAAGDTILYGLHQWNPTLWQSCCGRAGVFAAGIPNDRIEHLLWRVTDGGLFSAGCPGVFAVAVGTNNLFLNTDYVTAGIQNLVSEIHALCPTTRIALLSLLQRNVVCTQTQIDDGSCVNSKVRRVNRALALHYAQSDAWIQFHYITYLLEDPDGQPTASCYSTNNVQPTATGYTLISQVLPGLVSP